jgi:hypothetical protein
LTGSTATARRAALLAGAATAAGWSSGASLTLLAFVLELGEERLEHFKGVAASLTTTNGAGLATTECTGTASTESAGIKSINHL